MILRTTYVFRILPSSLLRNIGLKMDAILEVWTHKWSAASLSSYRWWVPNNSCCVENWIHSFSVRFSVWSLVIGCSFRETYGALLSLVIRKYLLKDSTFRRNVLCASFTNVKYLPLNNKKGKESTPPKKNL